MKPYKSIFREEDNIDGGLSDNLDCQQIADKHGVSLDFIMAQLDKGIKVEMEHTNDPEIAKEIAKDHLTELSDYYDRLKIIEENKMKKYESIFKESFNRSKVDKEILNLLNYSCGQNQTEQEIIDYFMEQIRYSIREAIAEVSEFYDYDLMVSYIRKYMPKFK